MHVLIVGGGAVGSLLGALLSGAGHTVTLVRIEETEPGPLALGLTRPDGSHVQVPVSVVPHANQAATPDLIVMAVKMFHLDAALEDCAAWPSVPLVTVENGIGAEAAAAAVRPAGSLIACSLTAAAALGSRAEVAWMSRGGVAFAAEHPAMAPLMHRLAGDLAGRGLRSAVLADPTAMKWSKLLVNLAGNAIPAILDVDGSSVYTDSRLFGLERAQMLEALDVIHALGRRPVALPGAPVPLFTLGFRVPAWLGRPILARAVGGARGGKMPSLRIAVTRGESPTEVCWMGGAVARAGDAAGVPTPVNARLSDLVDEVAADASRREYFRGRPDRLLGEFSGF